jgi:hypothetical protein
MTDNTVAKRNRTNNDLQNTTQKTKKGASQTPLNTGVTSGAGTTPEFTPVFTLIKFLFLESSTCRSLTNTQLRVTRRVSNKKQ